MDQRDYMFHWDEGEDRPFPGRLAPKRAGNYSPGKDARQHSDSATQAVLCC